MSGITHDGSIGRKARRWLLAASLAACVAAFATSASSQSNPNCRNRDHLPLTLNKLVELVQANNNESSTVDLLDNCSVAFTLDPNAIDRLAAAGASDRIMLELNQITSDHLSIEDAKAQVAALESRESDIEKQILADRDAEQVKQDKEFKAKREAAAHIPEKSQFESTSDYNARIQKSKDALAAMDNQHHQEELNQDQVFARTMQSKKHPYQNRAEFLKRLDYPVRETPKYGKYDADSRQLSALIGDDEYRFDRVPASDAETLYRNWTKVKVTRLYAEDDLHHRKLSLGGTSIEAVGYSYKAYAHDQQEKQNSKIAKLLADGKASLDRHDLYQASTQFDAVLAIDPLNQNAKDGIAAVAAARTKEAGDAEARRRKAISDLADQAAKGEWVDVRTGLMWQLKDNGSEISWPDAVKHCQELRTGGFTNWRLPSAQELFFLWEPGVTRMTPQGKSHLKFNPQAPTRPTLEKGTAPIPYHLGGGIELTAPGLWTFTPDQGRPGQYVAISFFDRSTNYAPFWKPLMRAVCVRP